MEELISIIVPIYNVERYLEKCVRSIINQTYKNIEIILINDGSKDNSAAICDEFLKQDDRIIVIHKENEGLSEARNVGLSVAKGKYVGFIDSDDYIEKDMFERMYNNLKRFNVDISICNMVEENEDGKKIYYYIDNNTGIVEFNKIEALKGLIIDKMITNHACNKLYKKELFNNIKYPYKRKMEDMATTYKIFDVANKVVVDSSVGYHYIQRKDSIMGNINKDLIEHYELAVEEKDRYLLDKYPELKESIQIERINSIKTLFYYCVSAGFKDIYNSKKYKKLLEEYRRYYKGYRKKIFKTINNGAKIAYELLNINLFVFRVYIILRKKMKR